MRQVYGLRGDDAARCAALLLDVEGLDGAKAAGWAATLAELRPRVRVPPRQSWAFEQLALKAELMALDHQIGDGKAWQSADDVAPVLPAIARRLELSERLWREVWGLGILRHIFIPARSLPEWHDRYVRFHPEARGNIIPGRDPGRKA